MEQLILPQLIAAFLLFATPLVQQHGLPSTEPLSKFFSGFLKSFRMERRSRKVRRVAMRGARPWWE